MRGLAVLLVSVGMSAAAAAQQGLPQRTIDISLHEPADGRAFVINLPAGIAVDSCLIEGAQTSVQGLRHQIHHRPITRNIFDVPTGKDARALTVLIWCRGYQAQLLDVPSIQTSDYRATLSAAALRTVKVTGRIQPDPVVSLSGKELHVTYDSLWVCRVLGGSECFFAVAMIAAAPIGADGSFAVEMPDVMSDPVLVKLRYISGFRLLIGATSDSSNLVRLSPGLPLQSSYPDPIVFNIIK